MARSMNWALDPRQQRRTIATPATQVAKRAKSTNSKQTEED